MAEADLYFRGLSDLQAFLDKLPAKIERNVVRGALRAGANVVKPIAQANIHDVSGHLAASLKVTTQSRGGRVTASVYTREFYAHFVEYGTGPHRIAAYRAGALVINGRLVKSVEHPGARARPFLRPALDTQAGAAVLAAAAYIRSRLATKEGLDTADVTVEEVS
jgi:HK97 gp10 family phage protein